MASTDTTEGTSAKDFDASLQAYYEQKSKYSSLLEKLLSQTPPPGRRHVDEGE